MFFVVVPFPGLELRGTEGCLVVAALSLLPFLMRNERIAGWAERMGFNLRGVDHFGRGWGRRNGLWHFQRQWGGGREQHGDTSSGGGGERQQRQDTVSSALQTCPIVEYRTQSELREMSVSDLLKIMKNMGIDNCNMKEKDELVKAIVEYGGTHGGTCGICCCDYESGDCLRKLKCTHMFHLECIDRWLQHQTNYSQRPPSCPVCNAPLCSVQETQDPLHTGGFFG